MTSEQYKRVEEIANAIVTNLEKDKRCSSNEVLPNIEAELRWNIAALLPSYYKNYKEGFPEEMKGTAKDAVKAMACLIAMIKLMDIDEERAITTLERQYVQKAQIQTKLRF